MCNVVAVSVAAVLKTALVVSVGVALERDGRLTKPTCVQLSYVTVAVLLPCFLFASLSSKVDSSSLTVASRTSCHTLRTLPAFI